jgi:hypothetical protein
MDWFSTHSGELDAQEQYTTGGTTVSVTSASSANQAPFYAGGQITPLDNVATLTAPNSFVFGDEVTVTGLPAPYDGTFQVVYANSTSFSYYTTTLGTSWNGTGSAYVPTWTNLGNPIQNNTTPSGNDDFYGISASAPPQPVVFNLTGIAGVNNNPNFGIRLVNAYDPYLSNTQTLTLGDTNNFTLGFAGTANGVSTSQNTSTIAYSANTATQAANIQAALAALSNVGSGNVTVTWTSGNTYSITFGNLLNVVAQPPIVANDTSDTIATNYQYANATEAGSPAEPVPYNGSKGNWRFDNIEVHGATVADTLPPYITPSNGAVYSWNNGNGSLNLTSGTLTFTGDQATSGDTTDPLVSLTASGSSANVVFNSTQHLEQLILKNGAKASIAEESTPSTLNTYVLSVDSTSTLDVTNNQVNINYAAASQASPNAGVRTSLISGSGTNGVTFNGAGIISSTAARLNAALVANGGTPAYTVGYADGSDAYLNGEGPAVGVEEIKFTLLGDLNLDGTVNSADFILFADSFGQSGGAAASYDHGDLNFDGNVNSADFILFADNFGKSLGNVSSTDGGTVLNQDQTAAGDSTTDATTTTDTTTTTDAATTSTTPATSTVTATVVPATVTPVVTTTVSTPIVTPAVSTPVVNPAPVVAAVTPVPVSTPPTPAPTPVVTLASPNPVPLAASVTVLPTTSTLKPTVITSKPITSGKSNVVTTTVTTGSTIHKSTSTPTLTIIPPPPKSTKTSSKTTTKVGKDVAAVKPVTPSSSPFSGVAVAASWLATKAPVLGDDTNEVLD